MEDGLSSEAREALERLRGMGFESPYHAWICVEHCCRCPSGLDYGEAFHWLGVYMDEVECTTGRDLVEEWERRYAREREEGVLTDEDCREKVIVLPEWLPLAVLAVLLLLLYLLRLR